jgi:tRNA (guanine37-N1)-methyltransferase
LAFKHFSTISYNEGLKLRKKLAGTLVDKAEAYNSFDVIGDIAITKLPDNSLENAQVVGQAILARHKNVKAVFVQSAGVVGSFRLRELTHLAGENRTQTVHKESGCVFKVDVQTCYFSPRLLHERQRIARLVQSGETVVNMFAGVGCFSILIAKQVPDAKVYSIDINPTAVAFMEENIRVNRVFGKVVPLLGDAKTIIETRLRGCADRVLMPLPEKAYEYLPTAVFALKPLGGWIHLHTFEHATKTQNPAEKVEQKVQQKMDTLGIKYTVSFVHVVRSTGPNWWQLVADIHVQSLNSTLP